MRLLPVSLLSLILLPAAAQTKSPIQLHDLKDAEALGAELYKGSGATGLVLVVVRGHDMFIHGYGETAPGSNVTPSEESFTRLCSLTKVFTTDLLAKLVADGTVHLDDPLQQYAPKGAVVPEKGALITLLDLATHTAGLTREIGTAPLHTPHFTYPDYETRWQWLQNDQLLFEPGTAAVYSNVGFDLLSDALADATHEPYPKLLADRTLRPLHMWETTLYPTEAQCARLMQSARKEGPCMTTESTMGSSGLYSTPKDMASWLRYLLGESAAETPKTAEDALAVYLLPSKLTSQSGLAHAGRPSGIGLGWLHLGANDDPSHIIEKTGGGAGFTTYIAIHPASDTALFVAATDGPPRAGERGFRLYRASNNALLALAGLPPLRMPLRRSHARRSELRAAKTSRRRHPGASVGRARLERGKAKRNEE
jgi:serine-type D-Ala-D-Ala carboxypeptidase/endopeptidase